MIEYGEIATQVINPDTGILEVCPKCHARPLTPCTYKSGRNAPIHEERIQRRTERREFIYEKVNYRAIQNRRSHHKYRREAKKNKGNKEYFIKGTKQVPYKEK